MSEVIEQEQETEIQEEITDDAQGQENEEETIQQEDGRIQEEVTDEEPETEETTADEEETVILLDDEPIQRETEKAPEWVRKLRHKNREQQKKIRELEQRVNAQSPEENVTLPPEPKLEDFDYDGTKFANAVKKWYDDKRKYDEVSAKKERDIKLQQENYNSRLQSYASAKSELNFDDYEDAENSVESTLSRDQQELIVLGADNPALLVYALGKNPQKLDELSKITDPVKYTFAIAKLETKLKTQKQRKPSAKPETIVTGSKGTSGAVGKELDRLRAEAERTGDYTKVNAFKRKNKT